MAKLRKCLSIESGLRAYRTKEPWHLPLLNEHCGSRDIDSDLLQLLFEELAPRLDGVNLVLAEGVNPLIHVSLSWSGQQDVPLHKGLLTEDHFESKLLLGFL